MSTSTPNRDRRRYRAALTLAPLATFALALPAWAQGQAAETVVITASRTSQALLQTSAATSVVTRQDLDRDNAMTLDQAVQRLPGVFAKRSKGLLDTLGGIQLRGIPDDNRTLILVDGLPLNDGYTGGVKLGGLSLADVDRIEVVRGAASSLYGGNAMGGVVQLLTRMPTRTEAQLTVGGGGALASDLGLDGQRSVAFNGGTAWDNGLSVRLSLAKRKAAGFRSDLVSTTSAPPATVTGAIDSGTTTGGSTRLVGERGANRWDDDAQTLAMQWQFTPGQRLRLTLERNHYAYGYGDPLSYLQQGGATVFGFTNGTNVLREAAYTAGGGEVARKSGQLRYDGQVAGARVQATLARIDLGTSNFATPDATAALRSGGPGRLTNTPSRTDLLDLQADWLLGSTHQLTVGGALRRDQADITERLMTDWRSSGSVSGDPLYEAHGRTQTRSLFAQDEWAAGAGVSATVGVRWDSWRSTDGHSDDRTNAGVSKPGFPKVFDARSDSSLSPKLGLVWKASDEVVWRASAGRAFRAPTTYDLYRTWIASSGTIFVSNPALTPETVRSVDAGVRLKPVAGVELGVSVFRNDMKDLIYRRTVTALTEARTLCGSAATTSNCRHFINAGQARSDGLEFELRQQLGSFSWFSNLTAISSVVLDNRYAPASVGKQIVGVPDVLFNLGGSYGWGPVTVSAAARSVGKAYRNDDNGDTVSGVYGATDARTVIDAKLNWQIHPQLRASLAVDNLADHRYFDFYRGPGRSWTFEVNARY